MDLLQPGQAGAAGELLPQGIAIGLHRRGVIADVAGEVGFGVTALAHPAAAGGTEGHHPWRSRPAGAQQFNHSSSTSSTPRTADSSPAGTRGRAASHSMAWPVTG